MKIKNYTIKVIINLISLLFISVSLSAQNLYINEFKAYNITGIQDESGEYSDWIEIYNSGATSVNLNGYALTDDKNDNQKWIFPAITISPGSYIYLFASGKDIITTPVIWETVIDSGEVWKYTVPGSNIDGWNTLGFSDAGWLDSISGFGYGDNDDNTIVPVGTMSVYVRKEFTVDDLTSVERGILHADWDDGFIAYINGVEIVRDNMGTPGSPVNYNDGTDSYVEPRIVNGQAPYEYEISDITDYLQEGTNVLAIEIHNNEAGSSDMTLIPFFSLGYSSFSGTPFVSDALSLPGSAMHTNFQLDLAGEFLGLYNASGNPVDTFTYEQQKRDISFGRSTITPSEWGFCEMPTPGAENSATLQVSSEPVFSILGGFYGSAQNLTLTNESATAEIFYTIDGTPPDTNSILYTVPINLSLTTSIRAFVCEDGHIPSEIITYTYFIGEDINLPVISLVTDPDNLFSDESGIYVTGTNGVGGDCDGTIRNLNQDWERPVNIEFYETTGEMRMNQGAGIKIFGGCSRTRYPQKSFSLFARSDYGKGSFKYQLFPDKQIDEFESFILRSAADDQVNTFFRDALAHYLLIEYMDADFQAYRPAVVFINGEYWGIHNIREKINEHYLAGNYNINSDNVNLLLSNASVIYGSATGYNSMMSYIQSSDMSSAVNYDYVKTQMDVNQYIDYEIGHIYLSERDWPGNNIKFWNANSGYYTKWRWINYDMDQTNTLIWLENDKLSEATDPNGTGWPNPSWSTLLLRNLLENEEFRNQFIQISAYHISTTFNPDRVLQITENFKNGIQEEIPRHITKWGGQIDPDMNESWGPPAPTFNSVTEWESKIEEIDSFAIERPQYEIGNYLNYFGLTGMSRLTVNMENTDDGIVRIYNKKAPYNGYAADYYRGVPIKLKAVSPLGYSFSHWVVNSSGSDVTYDEQEIEIPFNANTVVTAYFEENSSVIEPIILINEINYNSLSTFNPGDWVELYNRSNEIVDLSGWYFNDEDEDNIFKLPDGLELGPDEYLVLCEDDIAFTALYPDVSNFIGNLGFKFNNGGELIGLYNNNDVLIDEVEYDDVYPWPSYPDGQGSTLELISPSLNNDIAQNWGASAQQGSPGELNSIVSDIEESIISDNKNYKLHQNYPNPFNLSTMISYALPESANVRINVYNIFGKEVAAIVDQYQEESVYYVQFNADKLTAGIYFYTMQIDNKNVETKRMIIY